MYGLVTRRNREYDVFNLMDSFFNRSFFEPASSVSTIKTDIRQTDTEYIIEAEIPGFDKKDVKVELKNNYLTISANKEEENEYKTEGYLRRERRYGQVCRSFYVEGIDAADIEAKYDKGILEIKLPKKQKEEEVENTIEIK